jgi:hypothetical protein
VNGPEHYREAEKNLELAHSPNQVSGPYLVARAQVHAILALTAATIEDMDNEVLRPGWADVVGE